MIKKLLRNVAVLTAMTIGAAQAAVVSYTDQASYDAAVGAQVFLIDFDGLAGPFSNGVFAGQVDFGSPDATNPDQVLFGSNAMTDAGSTISNNNVGPIGGEFDTPVFAFRFTYLSGTIDSLELYDLGGALIEAVLVPSTGFIGVSSDVAIASFIARNSVFATTGGNDRFFIDNFEANGVSEVPLPAAFWFMGAGLAAYGSARKKKDAV